MRRPQHVGLQDRRRAFDQDGDGSHDVVAFTIARETGHRNAPEPDLESKRVIGIVGMRTYPAPGREHAIASIRFRKAAIAPAIPAEASAV